jgi:hypothetical protein
MAALEREPCPKDKGRIWHITDQLGRLIGWCDRCGTIYPRSTIPEPSPVPLMPYRRKEDHALERVLSVVLANPGVAKQAVGAKAGVNKERAVYALSTLTAEGKIVRRVKKHQQQGRATVTYYPADYSDIPPDDHSGPERVLRYLRAHTDAICTAHLARQVGISQHRVNDICGDLHKAGQLARCRIYITNSLGRRMPVIGWYLADKDAT